MNRIITDKEALLHNNICQNTLDTLSASENNERDLLSFVPQWIGGKNSTTAIVEIPQRCFISCGSTSIDNLCDSQRPLDHNSSTTTGSFKERNNVINIVEPRGRPSTKKDSDLSSHELTLILPRCRERCDSITESNSESKGSDDEQKYDIIISSSIANICWNSLLCSVKEKSPEKYAIPFLIKQEEKVFLCTDACQGSICSTCCIPEEECTQPKECSRATDLSAMGRLTNDLLILIRQMYHAERSMLFIGLIDVLSSMERNLAEFIVIAENATYLSTPLDFMERLIKLAQTKDVPYVYACPKEELGRMCHISIGISVISIKIGSSYFAEKIKGIKSMITNISLKSSVST